LNNKKFLEGTFVSIILAAITAALFVGLTEAIFASTFAMIAEGIELKFRKNTIDDNIIIPLVSSIVIYLLRIMPS